MAFRIQLRGAVIEADTARDVQELLVIMAAPLPRQLTAGVVPEPAARARRRRKARRGGGVRKAARPAAVPRVRPSAPVAPLPARSSRARGVPDDIADRILEALRAGVSKPADLAARVNASDVTFQAALRALRESGRVRVEGATVSRRYFLADGRARPKEGL